MKAIEYTLGDNAPIITAFLVRKSLRYLPGPELETAEITFSLRGIVNGVDSTLLDSIPCVLEDPETGLVSCELPDAGIMVEGERFRGRFRVETAEGKTFSYPKGRSFIPFVVRRP